MRGLFTQEIVRVEFQRGKKAEKKRKTMRQCKDRERREGKPMDAKLN